MPVLPKSIKLLRQLFQERQGALKHVIQRSASLLTLQEHIRALVPGEIYVANFDEGTLHLVTPSAALATRIKYSQKSLIANLRAEIRQFQVKSIRVSVRPNFIDRPPPTRSATPPGPESARHLRDTAKYIEDEPLRKALIRLSNRGKSIN